jgi:hypothetical protein
MLRLNCNVATRKRKKNAQVCEENANTHVCFEGLTKARHASQHATIAILYVDSVCSLRATMYVGGRWGTAYGGPYVELEQSFTRKFVYNDELQCKKQVVFATEAADGVKAVPIFTSQHYPKRDHWPIAQPFATSH